MKLIINILITVLLFTSIGFLVPYAYHSLNSTSDYYVLNSFYGEDVEQGSDKQLITINRDIPYNMNGEFIDELYLTDIEGDKTVHVRNGKTIYERRAPNTDIRFYFDIPNDLEKGTYYWNGFVALEAYPGVIKNIYIQSETFEVI
jgi:hypothetical protein